MIPVRLSRNAANYLRRETDYLRRRNPAAAGRFVDTIRQARRLLQTFPDAGNQAHALHIAGNRVLVVGDYLIEYAHDVTHIDITSIRHGRAAVKAPPVVTAHHQAMPTLADRASAIQVSIIQASIIRVSIIKVMKCRAPTTDVAISMLPPPNPRRPLSIFDTAAM